MRDHNNTGEQQLSHDSTQAAAPATIAEVAFNGKLTRFDVSNRNDVVQSYHVRGQFYELSDLVRHATLIPDSGVVIDVGANVGNHSLFYAGHTRAQCVYPLEPNPVAREILERNVALNRATGVHFDFVEYGAGKQKSGASVQWRTPDNLGAAKLSLSGDNAGPVAVMPLDDLFGQFDDIHFIKIDVEGMELDVLQGGANVIRKYRPALAVEVEKRSIAQFHAWTAENAYHVIDASRTHVGCFNFLCVSVG